MINRYDLLETNARFIAEWKKSIKAMVTSKLNIFTCVCRNPASPVKSSMKVVPRINTNLSIDVIDK